MSGFTIERIYLPSVDQSNAINAAKDKDVTRRDMAGFYRDCIIADTLAMNRSLAIDGTGEPRVDFKAVNEAILARWPKGLTFIKTLAWKELGH